MSVSYMQKTVADFFAKIDKIDGLLKQFSVDINQKRDTVLEKLADFKKDAQDLQSQYSPSSDRELSPVEQAVTEAMQFTHNTIANWEENIKRTYHGQEFMHKNEKYLLAMIFGQVKVGKSSLGNFIAGQKFKEAPFSNEYQNRTHPEFCLEKEGRTGNINTDEQGDTWFTEGVIDTTGAIQYFTISGLRWIDSPGTGALKKDGDTEEFTMEQMVNDYIDYTDLGIFLMNSSEPGLQTDMAYIQKMMAKGKDTLVVITRSDVNRKQKVDGKWVQVLHAKNIEDRNAQENYITNAIDEKYQMSTKYKMEKYKVLSVSTKLAANAIAQGDDELFKESNLDKFMMLLGDKVSADAVTMKEKNPKRNLNEFIDSVIAGYHSAIADDKEYIGIEEIEAKLQKTLDKADSYKKDIKNKTQRLTMIVCMKVKAQVQTEAKKWSDEVDKSGKSLDAIEISARINAIASQVLQKELDREVGKVISNFHSTKVRSMGISVDTGLEKETETIEHSYKEAVPAERDPNGIIEHVASFFGKTYYSISYVDRVKKVEVDLGTNLDKFIDGTMSTVNKVVSECTRQELEIIVNTYFKPQEDYVRALQTKLLNLKDNLLKLKYEL